MRAHHNRLPHDLPVDSVELHRDRLQAQQEGQLKQVLQALLQKGKKREYQNEIPLSPRLDARQYEALKASNKSAIDAAHQGLKINLGDLARDLIQIMEKLKVDTLKDAVHLMADLDHLEALGNFHVNGGAIFRFYVAADRFAENFNQYTPIPKDEKAEVRTKNAKLAAFVGFLMTDFLISMMLVELEKNPESAIVKKVKDNLAKKKLYDPSLLEALSKESAFANKAREDFLKKSYQFEKELEARRKARHEKAAAEILAQKHLIEIKSFALQKDSPAQNQESVGGQNNTETVVYHGGVAFHS